MRLTKTLIMPDSEICIDGLVSKYAFGLLNLSVNTNSGSIIGVIFSVGNINIL